MTFETKAGPSTPSTDVQSAMDDFLRTFEQFKSSNDDRLEALEKRGQEDIVLSEKIDRINKSLETQQQAMDGLSLKAQRPLRGGETRSAIPCERKNAFLKYMRGGDSTALHALDTKSLNTGNDAEGGYLAPAETERLITAAVRDISPIRQIASVREIGGTILRKPVSLGDGVSGWVGETDARPQTTAPTLAAIDFPTMELYAMPAASQSLLDDGVVDVEQWLADEVNAAFAQQEGAAFINGDGVNQPTGFLSVPIAPEGSQSHGQLGAIQTGVDGAFDTDNPMDTLFDLVYAPKQTFRNKGRFVMNRATDSQLRKFKDNDGN